MANGSPKENNFLIYRTDDGQTRIEVIFDGDTVWLTQDQMAELFQRSRPTVNGHLRNIFEDGELSENDVMTKVGNPDFSRQRPAQYYNLDAIIAVGYRVKSHRGIQFRKWATDILKEYMRKGFALNDGLLKRAGGGAYFKELLDRIRDIRSSEKVFYRQVLDIFATSIDYDAGSETATEFFKEMQNRLHFAVHGRTAAELIAERADAEMPFMGLQAFEGNRPRKSETVVAKNYLTEKEVRNLNLMVSAYLDLAEMKANEQTPMYMKDWVKELKEFITYRKMPVLSGAGTVSHEEAVQIAVSEYDTYRKKTRDELTQVEIDFLDTVRRTYELLEKKKPPERIGRRSGGKRTE